ncbi:MAG TPA: alpha-amylase/4-alpha-glucanotransferase domain-containing protein [Fibrobacteria bacterium]|nr:alpha-amylase/4-alpha-glucanotransferase domain-containing protein [Fibrobacteria bacterium]
MIHLLWAIHNHQPVGNFDFIFERAYGQAYKPFLDVLASHPKIRMSMHFSGILLDWLERHRPEYIVSLRNLVDRGQLEILGGGFYEPILPVISDSHKVGQLKKLSASVKRLFGAAPRGLWLAERVWEPTLVKPIAEAGLEYVLLDGSHFKMVGKSEDDMDGYFLSEDQGHTLKMFPIHDVIRDYIPFRPVEEVVDALVKLDSGRDVQVVFGDDGEKFGDWPGTHDHVYTHRWLHRFFEAVEHRSDHIQIRPLETGLKASKNLGLVYLPPASYQEMMVWAQDAHDIVLFRKAQKALEKDPEPGTRKFLRGTFWRNFFNKYAESNRIHKQGIRISRDLDALRDLPAAERDRALDHLWQSQCNCGYWHGVFGGLYLPHLRHALYRNLIEAQKVMDKALFAGPAEPGVSRQSREAPEPGVSRHSREAPEPLWEVHDWNCDGKPEYTLNSPEVYLSFNHRGEMDQFWLKATGINLADTLTRRYEAYHDLVGGGAEGGTKLENSLGEKEAGLRDHLVYDRRIRHSLADVYLAPETSFKEYATQEAPNTWRFEAHEAVLERRPGETAVRFRGVARPAAGGGFLRVEKSIILRKGSADLRVEWRFTAEGGAVDVRFGSEALFCLLAGNAHDRFVEWEDPATGKAFRDILASRGESQGLHRMGLVDEWLRLRCETRFPGATAAWRDALETVSQSEGGYERVYQGTVVLPVWDLRLPPGGEAEVAFSIQIREGA